MDSDTRKKVSDLLSFMENLSNEIDLKVEINKFREEIKQIREELALLPKKVSGLEDDLTRKREKARIVKKELSSLFGQDKQKD